MPVPTRKSGFEKKGAYLAILFIGFIIGAGVTYQLQNEIEQNNIPPHRPISPKKYTYQIGAIVPSTRALETYIPYLEDIIAHDINNFLDKLYDDIHVEFLIDTADGQNAIHLEKAQSFRYMAVTNIIGGFWDSQAQATLSFCNENMVLMVSPASRSDLLSIPDDYLYRFADPDSKQGPVLSRILLDQGKTRAIVINYPDYVSDTIVEAFITEYTLNQGSILEHYRLSEFPPEWDDHIENIDEALNSIEREILQYDSESIGIVVITPYPAAVLLAAEGHTDLLNVTWVGAENTFTPRQFEDYPLFVEESGFLSIKVSAPITGKYTEVSERFNELTGTSFQYTHATLYDASWVILESILQQQDTHGNKVRDILPFVAGNHFGVSGFTRLDAAGDRFESDYELIGYNWFSEGAESFVVGRYRSIGEYVDWN